MIESELVETRKIVGLICGCCQHRIEPVSHVGHLKSVVQKRWLNTNTWDNWYQRFEIYYLKTRVIFGNGLVVHKQNLIATDLGGYPAYSKLAKTLFKSLKESYH